jgi:hypothetical protein
VPLSRAPTPPPVFPPPLPPASGFESSEDDPVEEVGVASEVVRRASEVRRSSGSERHGRRTQQRKSSYSSYSTNSNLTASRGQEQQQQSLSSAAGVSNKKPASSKGYKCCSKREKSSALAAIIGFVSLASLMTGLVADMWVNTDEWIPSVTSSQEPLGQQPRHEAAQGAAQQRLNQRVHFSVGLWTVCPSYDYNTAKGTCILDISTIFAQNFYYGWLRIRSSTLFWKNKAGLF